MKSQITVRMEMLATHRWPDAPKHREYLSNTHAHVFKFEGRASVSHLDRQIEFHDLRTKLHEVVAKVANYQLDGPATFGEMSCEQIGEKILEAMPELLSVIVSEDGQFDAEVFREIDTNDVHADHNSTVVMRRVYLASASRGDRVLLLQVAKALVVKGNMVFVPCLGFIGQETPMNRPYIIDCCTYTLINWAQDLYILDEGIPSKGCDDERDTAKRVGKNIYIIDSSGSVRKD